MIPLYVELQPEALERLTDAFKGRHNVEGILKGLMVSAQLLEFESFEIMVQRLLDFAVDNSLDMLGGLVGEARNARGDAEYRAAIRIRIRINRSSGRAIDIVEIANLLAPGAEYREGDTAAYKIAAENVVGASSVLRMLGEAKPAGVYASFEFSTWANTNDDVWGSVSDAAAGAYGFTSVSNSLVGGKLVSAQEIKS